MAMIRRKMGYFDGTVAFHGGSEKTAYRQMGRWPETSVFGHSNGLVKNSLK
jgi:hypothetical protein